MAQPVSKRLEKIDYQIKKSIVGGFTKSEIVEKVQSLYDAAINASNSIDFSSVTLPTTVFGTVQLVWSNNNTSVSITNDDVSVSDDLTDEFVPTSDRSTVGVLDVNGEPLTVNGEYLEVVNTDGLLQVNDELFTVNGEYLEIA